MESVFRNPECLSGECGLHTIGLQALLGSGNWVGFLNCASSPGAELEESSKNTKKLDAMTLIKEGGSRHTEGWGSGNWTTFPSSTGGSSLKQQRAWGWGEPPFDRSESAGCPGSWDRFFGDPNNVVGAPTHKSPYTLGLVRLDCGDREDPADLSVGRQSCLLSGGLRVVLGLGQS